MCAPGSESEYMAQTRAWLEQMRKPPTQMQTHLSLKADTYRSHVRT